MTECANALVRMSGPVLKKVQVYFPKVFIISHTKKKMKIRKRKEKRKKRRCILTNPSVFSFFLLNIAK